jgi:hypothetical protein
MAVGFANSLGKPVVETVPAGGTSSSSFTAYAPVVAGSSGTSALVSATTGFSTVGNVLTSTGSSSAPTWQPAGAVSGGMVLLSTVTISTQATINLYNLFNATYDCYLIRLIDVSVGNNGQIAWLRYGTGATPIIASGGSDYTWTRIEANAQGTGTLTNSGVSSDSKIVLTNGIRGTGSADNVPLSGNFYLYNPSSTNHTSLQFELFYSSSASAVYCWANACSAMSTFTTPVTSLQFLLDGNNYISGTVKVYGLV